MNHDEYAANLLKFESLPPDQRAAMEVKAKSMGRYLDQDVVLAGDYRANVHRANSLQRELDELGPEQSLPELQPLRTEAKVSADYQLRREQAREGTAKSYQARTHPPGFDIGAVTSPQIHGG